MSSLIHVEGPSPHRGGPDSHQVPLDLASLVTALAADIQFVMASLYDVQTALLNLRRSDAQALSDHITQTRSPLRDNWEPIREFLQDCYAFGSNIVMVKDALRNARPEDLTVLLTELFELATELMERSQQVRDDGKQVARWFSKRVPELEDILRRHASTSPPSARIPKTKVGSKPPIPETAGMPGRLELSRWLGWRGRHVSEAVESHRKAGEEFVELCVASVHPDGLKALTNVKAAFDQISVSLRSIRQYLKAISRECKRFMDKSQSGKPNISEREADEIAQAWTRHQDALLRAITSIAKSSDVILLDALGPSAHSPTRPIPPFIRTDRRAIEPPVPADQSHPMARESHGRGESLLRKLRKRSQPP